MFTKKIKVAGALLLSVFLLLTCATACGDDNNSDDPVSITVLTYYSDAQLAAFKNLVNKFNDTVGAEKGIVVEAQSTKLINALSDKLLQSVKDKSGADPVPNIAAVYSETALILEQYGAIAPLDDYFTSAELSEYIPSYIEEGRLRENGPLYLIPISKSTEVAAYNKTDWQPFEADKGWKIGDIKTIEDMVAAAADYYEWSGGKALYGRDSLENYVYVSTAQMGHEMFRVASDGKLTIDLDRDTFKALWDNYYVPMINGYFYGVKDIPSDKSTYSADLMKTGKILALTCSTSAMTYFPTEVVDSDDRKHAVEAVVTKPLLFEHRTKDAFVQQGAAYCVMKTNKAEEDASVLFLKWFTEEEQSLNFAINSSYCPSKIKYNDAKAIRNAFGNTEDVKSKNILNSLLVSANLLGSGSTYACKPFTGAKDVRAYLGDALENTAIEDCQKISDAMAAGKSRADAIAALKTDFDTWFDGVGSKVKSLTVK